MITSNPAPPVYGTKGLTGQVLDILIDNALKHGAGAVTLMIDGPSVVVIDQGPGMSKSRLSSVFDGPVDPSAKHGRGLALARRLAQVDGGTLSVVGNKPLRLRFELVRGDVGTEHRLTSARQRASAGQTAGSTPARLSRTCPKNQSPPPGGGIPGDGERKETSVSWRRPCVSAAKPKSSLGKTGGVSRWRRRRADGRRPSPRHRR